MINTNRIVPIERVDLISMYGLILKQDSNNSSMVALQASSIDGDFAIGTGLYLAAQPLKSGNFTGSSGTILFVADYAFEGFTVDGAAATIDTDGLGLDDVNPDGCTLYKAVLATGEVTITQIGF